MPKFLDDGGWVAIDKAGVASLPRGRSFSEVEAMFSLTVDLDAGIEKGIREYARIWHWSKGRVARFLTRIGLPNAASDEDTSGDTNGDKTGTQIFSYVAPLRRSGGRGRGHQRGQQRPTTLNPDPDPRKKKSAARTRKPWAGLTGDAGRLLASDAFLLDLATSSPVLSHWSLAEVRTWAQRMVTRGVEKRAREGDRPLQRFDQFLRTCADRVGEFERPREVASVEPRELAQAAAGMGLGGSR